MIARGYSTTLGDGDVDYHLAELFLTMTCEVLVLGLFLARQHISGPGAQLPRWLQDLDRVP